MVGIRKELRMTQRAMAEMFDVSPSHWSRIENGVSGIGGSLFREVCQRLGADAEWLVSGSGEEPKCLRDKELVIPFGSEPHRNAPPLDASVGQTCAMTYDILHDEKAMEVLRKWSDVTGCTERDAVIETVRRKLDLPRAPKAP